MTIQIKAAAAAGSETDFNEVKHAVLRRSNREIGHSIA